MRTLVLLASGLTLAGACFPGSATAQEQPDAAIAALTEAAIAGTQRGDEAARRFLGMLLDLPEPMAGETLRLIERSDVIEALRQQRESGPRRDRDAVDTLLVRIAGLQGAEARGNAVNVSADAGSVVVDLSEMTESSAQWLLVDGSGAPGELYIETQQCTPTITAFAATTALPGAPIRGQSRFSALLASVPVTGPVALRIVRGDCEDDELRMALSRGAERASEKARGNGSEIEEIESDRVTVVTLGRRPARHLALATEPGFTYEILAAPIGVNVDPALVLGEPEDPASVAGLDDDSGWELGARLEEIVGTGRRERIALMRASADQGEVAVLVKRRAVLQIATHTPYALQLTPASAVWMQAELSAGRWDLRLEGVSDSLDPAMIVHDAATGKVLESNDDENDESLAPRVHLDLKESTVVLIKLVSVEGQGDASLSVRPDGRASTVPQRHATDPKELRT